MANKIVYSKNAPDPIGPYSQAVQSNNMLFVSGQIPIDAGTGELLIGHVEDETRLVMKNLGAILEAGGYSFADVVKCSIFLKNMNDFPKVNAIYGTYFPENPPARETVEVSQLPKGVRVEISCIACK